MLWLKNTKKGSYIVESVIVIPIFIMAVVMLMSIIPIIATCENVNYAVADETHLECIKTAFRKNPAALPAAVKHRIYKENQNLNTYQTSFYRYLYTACLLYTSIGIPLAVSSNYSFVAKTATMTMHPIRTSGTLITADATFEYMRRTQERVVDFIVEHSNAVKEDVEAKMNQTGNMSNDVGTVLFGPDAVKMGLVNEIGGLNDALAKLKELAKN